MRKIGRHMGITLSAALVLCVAMSGTHVQGDPAPPENHIGR